MNSRIRKAIKPVIESLERRQLLSVSVTSPSAGVLNISGDSNNNNVLIYENDTPANNPVRQTVVEVYGQGLYTFDNQIFDRINVDLGKGDDRLSVVMSSNFDSQTQTMNVGLGQGNDDFDFGSAYVQNGLPGVPSSNGADITNSNVTLKLEGGQGNDNFYFDLEKTSLLNSTLSLNVEAADGVDTVQLETPDFNASPYESITDSTLTGKFTMANGNDRVELSGTTDVRDSTVQMTIDAGNDNDAVRLDGAPSAPAGPAAPSIPAVAPLAVGLIGSSSYTVNASMGNGDDELLALLDFGSAGSIFDPGSSLAITADGGNGKDTMDLELVPGSGGSSSPINGSVALKLLGQNGTDNLKINGGSSTLLQVPSGGQVSAYIDGGNQNDIGIINLATTNNSNGLYNLKLLGGNDNDTLGLRFQNNGTNTAANYVGGSAVLNGGGGTDRWDVDGNVNLGFITVLNAEIEDDSILPGG